MVPLPVMLRELYPSFKLALSDATRLSTQMQGLKSQASCLRVKCGRGGASLLGCIRHRDESGGVGWGGLRSCKVRLAAMHAALVRIPWCCAQCCGILSCCSLSCCTLGYVAVMCWCGASSWAIAALTLIVSKCMQPAAHGFLITVFCYHWAISKGRERGRAEGRGAEKCRSERSRSYCCVRGVMSCLQRSSKLECAGPVSRL